ncbi:uncharacterized protein THITE_2106663 [Thermothielavioides terrestris NRRL 8126]|uniref:Uncharacterized protein n=1 Tax=Thermothielavioides terrestris (strain ATCC 38088 / NRRL 8126) TaxID=578455 RepID=G2QR15_THETT|nr:uncharacterized protein THITE_2106663 [Thermothielavioides terrestris NRRL 8126]AEO62467.1 hypothetical protein THITE_2106663 [Thermothielavioides terrestris NRRL 8126]
MARGLVSPVLEKKPTPIEPVPTCIVNEAGRGEPGVCGREAASGRECAAPVCAERLCQYRHADGQRCRKTPLRLEHGTKYLAASWFPDITQSVNCEDHEKHNCVQLIDGVARCSEMSTPLRNCCPAHDAVQCKWGAQGGVRCSRRAEEGSRHCENHRWYEQPLSHLP